MVCGLFILDCKALLALLGRCSAAWLGFVLATTGSRRAGSLAAGRCFAACFVACFAAVVRFAAAFDGFGAGSTCRAHGQISHQRLAGAQRCTGAQVVPVRKVGCAHAIAIGYADQRPVETNDSAEGRARNRRVTLNILADNRDEVAVLAP